MSLKDKIVLITGAGRGLGKRIARAFANAGAKIAVNERQETDSADTVQMIKSAGGDAIRVGADISSSQDVQRMFKTGVDTYGTLDVLVNNAAVTPSTTMHRERRVHSTIINRGRAVVLRSHAGTIR
jgi:3-oxoacyl-[acyl-carrier protein] reductase